MSATFSPPSSTPQQPQLSQHPIYSISCTACRQRKIKCPRINPCLPCQQAGYSCEFPPRRQPPRKKRGKMGAPPAKVAELADRLADVEALLKQLRPDGNHNSLGKSGLADTLELPGDDELEAGCSAGNMGNEEERYGDCSFWTALCEKIGGLQQLLGERPDPPDTQYSERTSSQSEFSDVSPELFSNLVLTGNRASADTQIPLSRRQAMILLDIFTTNVDPVIKLLHIPSLRQRVEMLFPTQETGLRKRVLGAGIASVFFASTTSMTEEQCQTHLNIPRRTALSVFRSAVEAALTQANFMERPEITTLQALVLFLACLRSTDRSKSPWTMVAVAVRLAHMLNLHRDGKGLQYTPFEAEMRRRLWWAIVLLDMRASEDWGSDFIISEDSFNTSPPTNIEDDDMKLNSSMGYVDQEGVTKMTFGLMFREGGKLVKLFHVPLHDQPSKNFQERLKIILSCQKELNENFFPMCDSGSPISWVTHTIGRLIIYKAWLMVHYPMQPQDWTTMDTTVKREDLLMTSVMILELSYKLETNEDVQQWWWLFKTYIQWHALAVTLVEVCVQPQSPLTDKAWRIVNIVFDLWSRRVVDTSSGFVWLPIKKLYKKAQQARMASASAISSASDSDFTLPPLPPAPHNHAHIGYTDILDSSMHNAAIPHDVSSSDLSGVYELAQVDLGIGNYAMEDWQADQHHDPMVEINWADWDGFIQDASGLPDLSFIP